MSGHTIGARIDGLLGMLWDARGTDLLLTAGMPPQARVHGDLHAVPNTPVLTADDTNSLLAELLTVTQTKGWDAAREYDFSFSWRERRTHPRQRVHPARRDGRSRCA